MKNFLYLLAGLFLFSCNTKKEYIPREFNTVDVEEIYSDSISIRAIELTDEGELWFAANKGIYGRYTKEGAMITERISVDTIYPAFRSVAYNGKDAFALSIANPALLFKLTPELKMVYKEVHENVFYDSMTFWNEKEGIAMGDPTDNCLSIIITRDGGDTWTKLSCDKLPQSGEGEAAFAASDTNIAIYGDHTWIVSGGMRSRVFYSLDRGESWEVYETPIIQGVATQGIYSVDFYDENNGVVIGGDYTKPEGNEKNKAVTTDGGKTWTLVSDGGGAVYKSCVQYIPGSQANEMVAVGFTGISFSNDSGNSWKKLSDEGFYTIKFLNDSTAYAAGRNRIARLRFK
ncbi:oxidoreductase [Leptobacterium flavescens]|uniref:Oxidoreductase n=1 Tax=Leptobacterium flavescens TaxID=472055 RepID=A0A6P0UNV6_9FLAO|nr:oxidoreductase [Leptobacterium flavescens]NER12016.1 oxidoreductase [Leptobacterium flavescens]